MPLNSTAEREKATQDRLDEPMKALPEDDRIRENPFIANVIASKANAAGLSIRQVLDISREHEMLKRNVASRKIEIDALKKFAKYIKLNTPVPADILKRQPRSALHLHLATPSWNSCVKRNTDT